MKHLKVNITYVCDMGCPNCNRATRHCPSNHGENLTPEQFAHMLSESARVNYPWARMVLTGGEPSMHPKISDMIDVMMDYKHSHNPNMYACVCTYHHPRFFHKLEEAKVKHPDLVIQDTQKEKPRIHRYATYVAPIDDPRYGPDHPYNGCHHGGHLCGLCYDYQGFHACVCGAAISKVFGFDIAIKNIEDLNRDNFMRQYQTLCARCGYYKPARAHGTREPMSAVWKKAVAEYKLRRKIGGAGGT